MKLRTTIGMGIAIWLSALFFLHAYFNLHWFNARPATKTASFRVGFLPVTCHLTCPVADFIRKNAEGSSGFEPVRFQGWPELKEAFLAGNTSATFILAPLAMKLREEGIPIKIVYLGHRDGSAMVVNKDSSIYRVADLRGKKIAIPNRFSNQWLLVLRALRQVNLQVDDVQIVEMPPPDMPSALNSHAVDAITSGEPFMAQTELDGYGRVLYLTKDIWPNFISCVLAVSEDVIQKQRDQVQNIVDGIAKSGKWLDTDPVHRVSAAEFVGKYYYNQNPALLRFVLSKPPDRVKYTGLAVHQADFEEIESLGKSSGLLRGTVHFRDYADPSFVPDEQSVQAYRWEYPH